MNEEDTTMQSVCKDIECMRNEINLLKKKIKSLEEFIDFLYDSKANKPMYDTKRSDKNQFGKKYKMVFTGFQRNRL